MGPKQWQVSYPTSVRLFLIIIMLNSISIVIIIIIHLAHTNKLGTLLVLDRATLRLDWDTNPINSKDCSHDPIERQLNPYVMAIDSTVTFRIHMLSQKCTLHHGTTCSILEYIIYNSYTGIRWLSTLTSFKVSLKSDNQARQNNHL